MKKEDYLLAVVHRFSMATREDHNAVIGYMVSAWERIAEVMADDLADGRYFRSFKHEVQTLRTLAQELDFPDLVAFFLEDVAPNTDWNKLDSFDENESWYLCQIAETACKLNISTADSFVEYMTPLWYAFFKNTCIHAGVEFEDDSVFLWPAPCPTCYD